MLDSYLMLPPAPGFERGQAAETAAAAARAGSTASAREERLAQRLGWLLVLALLGGGLAALAISLLPYDAVLRRLAGGSQGRMPASFTPEVFAQILFRLRVCGLILLASSALLAALWRALANWIRRAVLPLPAALVHECRSAAQALAEEPWVHKGALAALVAMGAVLRTRLLSRPVSFDEADTFLSYASKPLYIGLSWYSQPNNHLFHTFWVHWSWRLFGEEEWAIRLPALCAGILMIPAAYWAGRVLYGKYAGLIAASLVACSGVLVSYSANGRGYTLLCVWFLCLLGLGRRLLDEPSPPLWLLWALVAALGFHTIPIMLYAAGSAALWLALSALWMPAKRRHDVLWGLAGALVQSAILTVLLYTPVAIVTGPSSIYANAYVLPRTFEYLFAGLPGNLAGTWTQWTRLIPGPAVWLFAAGFAAGLALHRRTATHSIPVPLAAAAFIAAALLAQRVVPFPRVWLFLLPLCAAITAAGLWRGIGCFAGRGNRREIVAALCALGCFLWVGGFAAARGQDPPRRASIGMRAAAAWITVHSRPGDMVVARITSTAPLSYYFRRAGLMPVQRAAPWDSWTLYYDLRRPGPVVRRRTFVVVDDQSQRTSEILAYARLSAAECGEPALVHRASGASIYEAGRGCDPAPWAPLFRR